MTTSGFGDTGDGVGALHDFYWGTVVRNDDPEKLGRVRVHVHGLTRKETDWAFPVGMPGAGAERKGGFTVPRLHSTVLVGFVQGDFDEPFYFAGPHARTKAGTPGSPRKVQEQTPAEAPKVTVITETENFEIYVIETAAEQRVVIQTLGGKNQIEMDARDGSIVLKAARYLILEAPAVSIDGLAVQICRRPVSIIGEGQDL